jgi:hypothetical protein
MPIEGGQFCNVEPGKKRKRKTSLNPMINSSQKHIKQLQVTQFVCD